MNKEKICEVLEEYKGRFTVLSLGRKVGEKKMFCISGACLREAGVPDEVLLDEENSLYTDIPIAALPEETVEILREHYGDEILHGGWIEPTIKLFGILAAVYDVDANEREQLMEVNDYGAYGDEKSFPRDIYASLHRFLGCDTA